MHCDAEWTGPHPSIPVTTPRPEDSAHCVIDAYARKYKLSIDARGGIWVVTGGGIEEPIQVARYSDLVAFLGRTFGNIGGS